MSAAGDARRGRWSRGPAFWLVGISVMTVLAASSAPSPLYPVYADRFALSPGMVTAVFAVYAFALLAALLTVGGISDHVGRRPVLMASLLLEAVSLGLFAVAGDATGLIVARIVQGLATGAFTGVASAALVDLEPAGSQLGALLNSAGATLGLAVGSLGSGILIELAPLDTVLVYLVLLVAVLVLVAALWRLPETSERRPGVLASLRPRVGVPENVRGRFLVVLPIIVATWSMGGLFLSLGPTIARDLLGLDNRIEQGLVVAAFTASGSVVSTLTRRWEHRRMMLTGAAVLAVGTAVTVLAVHLGDPRVFVPGEMLAGAGFGMSFLGAYSQLTALSEPARRAELLAAVFVVNYLAFSLPTLAAGLMVPVAGLQTVAQTYGSVVVGLALLLLGVETVVGRRAARARPTGRS